MVELFVSCVVSTVIELNVMLCIFLKQREKNRIFELIKKRTTWLIHEKTMLKLSKLPSSTIMEHDGLEGIHDQPCYHIHPTHTAKQRIVVDIAHLCHRHHSSIRSETDLTSANNHRREPCQIGHINPIGHTMRQLQLCIRGSPTRKTVGQAEQELILKFLPSPNLSLSLLY